MVNSIIIEVKLDTPRSFEGVRRICEIMELSSTPAFEGFGQWLTGINGPGCWDTNYARFVDNLSKTELNSSAAITGARSGFYQKCTKSALLQITDDNSWTPHRVPLEYFMTACEDVLGEK